MESQAVLMLSENAGRDVICMSNNPIPLTSNMGLIEYTVICGRDDGAALDFVINVNSR